LVRNIDDHESVVQKNRVETLQRHGETLEQNIISIISWWFLVNVCQSLQIFNVQGQLEKGGYSCRCGEANSHKRHPQSTTLGLRPSLSTRLRPCIAH